MTPEDLTGVEVDWARQVAGQYVVRMPLMAGRFDDLRSAALEALVGCCRRWDPQLGSFRAFAWRRMRGAVVDEHRRLYVGVSDGMLPLSLEAIAEQVAANVGVDIELAAVADGDLDPAETVLPLLVVVAVLADLAPLLRDTTVRRAAGVSPGVLAAEGGVTGSAVSHRLALARQACREALAA